MARASIAAGPPLRREVLLSAAAAAMALAFAAAVLTAGDEPGRIVVSQIPPRPRADETPLGGRVGVRQSLPDAPDPALIETRGGFALPRLGPDGAAPWRAYARPFDPREDRPRIAVVVAGLGLGVAASEQALERLPGVVTFAVDAYARDPAEWARRARRAGHETLSTTPIQSAGATFEDAGPKALSPLTAPDAFAATVWERLAAVPGAVGVLAQTEGLGGGPILKRLIDDLAARGLLLVDAPTRRGGRAASQSLDGRGPAVRVDVVIDAEPEPKKVDAALTALEKIAVENMAAVGLASTLPVSVARIEAWGRDLGGRNLVLAPVSAAVEAQDLLR